MTPPAETDATALNAELICALSQDLQDARYTVDAVAELLGEGAYEALGREQPIPAQLAVERLLGSTLAPGSAAAKPLGTKPETTLAAVIALFLLAAPLHRTIVDKAFSRLGAAGLLGLNLVETTNGVETDGALRARVDLRPYAFVDEQGEAELWVASDLSATQRPGVLRHDHVLGIGQASLTLAQATIRTPVPRALDLGTGCGIQAFHLLRHAEHVTLTDISARALAFTRFNLLLNAGALNLDPERLEDRVSIRLGSLFEPVQGEHFDLVVSNPPFVITPRHQGESAEDQFTYRDGGLPGDELVAAVLRGLPAILADGGVAQLLGNWEIQNKDWSARLSEWIDPALEPWVIQREQLSPQRYAETWLQDASEARDPQLYRAAYRDYLADFAARQVERIGFGLITLRKPQRPRGATQKALNPLSGRFEELLHSLETPLGPHLAATLERRDWLAGTGPELRAARLLVPADVTEERHQRPGDEHPQVILLRQGAGLRRTALLSTEAAGFVSACDGSFTVGALTGALAALLEVPVQELESALIPQICQLVDDGFLVPAADHAEDTDEAPAT
ncbi:DUF7059 domain-containing protein [Psychromicrobium xiongbiense]|uniref:DUF7059 domain-containing protein n=1 Tax=Psychromicrobium xiongbiense TaxID=3051184 RepID=UPI002553CBF6|nr:methyltransferase [Psychromicrobium sp. YIM S02556]